MAPMEAVQLGRAALVAACLFALGACSLPRGAALETEIVSKSQAGSADFQLVLVDTAAIDRVADWPRAGAVPSERWIPRHRGPASPIIATGDRIDLAVWDSEENSLFTSPAQMVVDIKALQVSPQGSIFVPYLDEIPVVGETPDTARRMVQDAFSRILPAAQVQLHVSPGKRNTVDLVGGVAQPGSFPLPDRDYTVLSLLSAGGGITPGTRNPQVRLHREGQIYGISADRLFDNPAQDTTLRGGDKIFVEEDERYFLSLGATGREELVYFEKDHITALEALSIIGGVRDARANPEGVLVLREYPADVLRQDGTGPEQERVIFSLDLTTADGLFSARRFPIRAGDVVLATESPVTAVETVLRLFGSVFGTALRVNRLNN